MLKPLGYAYSLFSLLTHNAFRSKTFSQVKAYHFVTFLLDQRAPYHRNQSMTNYLLLVTKPQNHQHQLHKRKNKKIKNKPKVGPFHLGKSIECLWGHVR